MSDTLKKPAQKFTQTERTGWILKMTAKEIAQILPRREEPEQLSLFTDINRPITSRHLDSIERFLTDTSDWAMPSIILAVAPGAISETRNTIEVSPDQLQVLDGQHRIQAFYNVIHGWEMDAPRDESNGIQEKLDQISKEELPVVIMEVRDKKDQRQIFAWFARNKPIEPAVREFFDLASGEHREPRTGPPAGNRTIRQPCRRGWYSSSTNFYQPASPTMKSSRS